MIFAGFALTAVLGWLVLPRRLGLRIVSGLSLGFALAAFGISFEMFLADLAGLPWNSYWMLLPWLAAAGWLIWRQRPGLGVEFHAGAGIALSGAVIAAVVWLPLERTMPLTSQTWDAWAIWLFKAKAFYLDGGLAGYFERVEEFTGQPGYPLLVPLYGTFLYGLGGEVNDQAAKFLSPCYFFALLGAFYYLARRAATPLIAGTLTAALALTPMVARVAFGLPGYADTALSVYVLLAGGFLLLWMRDGSTLELGAGALAATAAAWTKNEGQLFLLGFGLLAAGWMLLGKRPWREWLWLATPPAVVLGVWTAVRSSYGIDASGFALIADFQPSLFRIALQTMTAKALAPAAFVLTFPLLLAAVIGGVALRLKPLMWVAPALVAWHFAGSLLAYATGRNEIFWWLETSADRLIAQITPLALLAVAIVLGLWPAPTRFAEPPSEMTEPTSPARGARRSRSARAKR